MTRFDRPPGDDARRIAATRFRRAFAAWAIAPAASLLIAGAFASPALAQPAADPFADPFGTPPAAATPAPGTPAATPADPFGPGPVDEPAVLAILESNPQTPVAKLRAAQALLSLKRPDLAKRFLGEISAALNPAVAFDLVSTYGGEFFWDLSRRTDLDEAGRAFADAVYENYDQYVGDPANVQADAAPIGGESPAARERGLRVIAGAGDRAVAPLAEILARPGDTAATRGATSAFGRFPWLPPVIPALLDSNDPQLVARAIALLGAYGPAERDLRALGFLKHPDPLVREAAERHFLDRLAELPDTQVAGNLAQIATERYLGGMISPYVASVSDVPRPRTTWWVWDAETGSPVRVTGLPIGASLNSARQLAEASVALDPDSEAAKVDYLVAQFASRAELHGADEIPEEAIAEWEAVVPITQERLHAAARRALAYDLPGALATAMTLFGLRDDESALHAEGLERPIVAEALRHASEDVRFAAALAVARMAPDFPFREGSRVLEVLSRYSRPAEAPIVCLGHPRSSLATSYATILAQSGFEVHVALTPEDLFKECRRRAPRLYAIVFHERLPERAPIEYVSQLRKDPATANVPIVVLAIDPANPSLRFLTQDFEKVRVIGQDLAAAEFRQLADEFEPGVENALLVVRGPRTTLALEGIERLMDMPQNPMGLAFERIEGAAIEALSDPRHAPAAARILARLGSPAAQTALVEAATQTYLPVEARDAALAAFADAVARRGILLTHAEILVQYDRYNESRTLDADTQRLRGAILDVLESKVSIPAPASSGATSRDVEAPASAEIEAPASETEAPAVEAADAPASPEGTAEATEDAPAPLP